MNDTIQHRHTIQDLLRLATTSRALSESRITSAISLLVQNARYALQALDRDEVAIARVQALSHPRCLHPRSHGATLFGLTNGVLISADWAAWANTLAVVSSAPPRKAQPTQRIFDSALVPTLIAVAQQAGANGDDLLQGIAVTSAAFLGLQRTLDGKIVDGQERMKLQGIWAAQAMACGIGRCLHLSSSTVQQVLQQIQQDSVIPHAPVADIARQVIGLVDLCMRGEESDAPQFPERAENCYSLNDATPSAALEDEFTLFAADTAKWLSTSAQQNFLACVRQLPQQPHAGIMRINPAPDLAQPQYRAPDGRGIF